MFKDKTERFTVYFDAVDGNLAVLDTEGGIDFFETSKLLSLNETELRVLKEIIDMKDDATHAKISSELGITETAINDASNSLMKKASDFILRKKERAGKGLFVGICSNESSVEAEEGCFRAGRGC